eukprot:TRINITY_DN26350_c0_g1_i1.p1 TRINITY_DN26350_c0_g1~~TRINITY_DN26350_c0_g1_i1.p1  ORF type:complete len:390 (+),score=86.23 TRINITY_DN26350_c0_g1_i1:123-1292(+)
MKRATAKELELQRHVEELDEALQLEREEHRIDKKTLRGNLQKELEHEREQHRTDVDALQQQLEDARVTQQRASVVELKLQDQVKDLDEALELEREEYRKENEALQQQLEDAQAVIAGRVSVVELELQQRVQELDEALELEREQRRVDNETLQEHFEETLALEREQHRVSVLQLKQQQREDGEMNDSETQMLRGEVNAWLQGQLDQQIRRSTSLEEECKQLRSRNVELEQECARLSEQLADATRPDRDLNRDLKFESDSRSGQFSHIEARADAVRILELESECRRLREQSRRATDVFTYALSEWTKLVDEVQISAQMHAERLASFASDPDRPDSYVLRRACGDFREDVASYWHLHANRIVERYACLREVQEHAASRWIRRRAQIASPQKV